MAGRHGRKQPVFCYKSVGHGVGAALRQVHPQTSLPEFINTDTLPLWWHTILNLHPQAGTLAHIRSPVTCSGFCFFACFFFSISNIPCHCSDGVGTTWAISQPLMSLLNGTKKSNDILPELTDFISYEHPVPTANPGSACPSSWKSAWQRIQLTLHPGGIISSVLMTRVEIGSGERQRLCFSTQPFVSHRQQPGCVGRSCSSVTSEVLLSCPLPCLCY